MRAACVLLTLIACACGPSAAARKAQSLVDRGDYAAAGELAASELAKNPRDGDLWRVRIRAALGQHDARGAVGHYQAWRDVRGGADDGAAMRMMALTTLWQALESPSAKARIEAIRAVERLELERLADAVADRMADDDDAVAAAAAIAILRAFPQAPGLATDLLGSADPVARAIAVEGIGRKVGARAADDLRRLADDPDPAVRRAVTRALGAIADRADTDRLRALAGDADRDVRAAAVAALARGKRGDLSEVARRALDDDHLGVRIAAVALLDASGDRQTLAGLLTGDDVAVATHAARALAGAMRVDATAVLDRALGDRDWTVRAGALNSAHAIAGAGGARTRAEAALADDRVDVRLAAARLLGDDRRAIAVFVEALDAADVAVGAAVDLARLGDARGLAALDRLGASEAPGVRRAVAAGYRQARRASVGAVVALADADPVVRIVAAESILAVVSTD
jgi:HEAT repeat protein